MGRKRDAMSPHVDRVGFEAEYDDALLICAPNMLPTMPPY